MPPLNENTVNETILSEPQLEEMHARHIDYFREHSNARIHYYDRAKNLTVDQEMPYVIEVNGKFKGPQVLFGGGVHGNEPAGVEAAVRIHQALTDGKLTLKYGEISFLLGNPAAYQKRERFIEVNLNRIFTDNFTKIEDPETQRAREVQQYLRAIRDHLRAIVDFHSVSRSDFTMSIYNHTNEFNWKVIRTLPSVFSYNFGYQPEHLNGILSDTATVLNHRGFDVDGFSIECGNHSSPKAIDRALAYMKTICEEYGLVFEGEWPEGDPASLELDRDPVHYHTIAKIEPCQGFEFTIPDIDTGTVLAAGDVYAVVKNEAGEIIEERKAPANCDVVMPASKPDPNDVDAGFLCQKVKEAKLSNDHDQLEWQVIS